MPVPMPAVVVLIVCKTAMLPADQHDINSKWTGYENRTWAYEDSMMQCKRKEVQLYDQSEAMGADPQPFNTHRCQRAGIMLGVQWDQSNKHTPYRFWRVACPVPIVNTQTGEVIGWKKPECASGKWRGKVVCDVDSEV